MVGYGADALPGRPPGSAGARARPSGAVAAYVAAGGPTLEPVPLYLRQPDATPSGLPKRVLT